MPRLKGISNYKYKHGGTELPEFNIWQMIKDRCSNPNNIGYHRYGGRGIKICKRWNKFVNFYKDMGVRPSIGHSIDRINNDGDYEPQNCRWATRKEQARNRIQNVTYKNECALDASNRLGGGNWLVSKRIRIGWNIEKAFTTPVRPFKGYSFKNNRYVVNLWVNGKSKYLGSFKKEKDAIKTVKNYKSATES